MTEKNDATDSLFTLMQDWQTIWQNEWAAMAVDREMLEGMAQAWTGLAEMVQGTWDVGSHTTTTATTTTASPTPGPSPGAAPAADASGAGSAEIERLTRQVAELERRLADLDQPNGAATPSRRRRSAAARS